MKLIREQERAILVDDERNSIYVELLPNEKDELDFEDHLVSDLSIVKKLDNFVQLRHQHISKINLEGLGFSDEILNKFANHIGQFIVFKGNETIITDYFLSIIDE